MNSSASFWEVLCFGPSKFVLQSPARALDRISTPTYRDTTKLARIPTPTSTCSRGLLAQFSCSHTTQEDKVVLQSSQIVNVAGRWSRNPRDCEFVLLSIRFQG